MTRRHGRPIVAAAAAAAAAAVAVALSAGSGPAEAATAPVSHARIVAHFSLAAGQTPEDIALEPGAAVDVSFAKADQVARVTRAGGNIQRTETSTPARRAISRTAAAVLTLDLISHPESPMHACLVRQHPFEV